MTFYLPRFQVSATWKNHLSINAEYMQFDEFPEDTGNPFETARGIFPATTLEFSALFSPALIYSRPIFATFSRLIQAQSSFPGINFEQRRVATPFRSRIIECCVPVLFFFFNLSSRFSARRWRFCATGAEKREKTMKITETAKNMLSRKFNAQYFKFFMYIGVDLISFSFIKNVRLFTFFFQNCFLIR